jgi:phosphopantothenoylcysteine decarboxylase/phosphopantothenate--cysteine ligase
MTATPSTPPSPLPLLDRRIVVAVTGGIAAYKAADLVSRLRKAGAQARVAMTPSAAQFVQPLTFEALSGHPVYRDVFERPASWEMEHISWARWAETVVVAPASANSIARLAHGIADDAVTTLALAFEGTLWLAPAMNTSMWNHPATQANLRQLVERGARVIEPESGPLACGETGAGRMAQPEAIVERLIEAAGARPAPLAGRTVLITAGPTREALDPIRFISNRSSGRMGAALAAAARELGARVIVTHGPLEAPLPAGVEGRAVESARAMLAAVQGAWGDADIAIFAAAVANYEAPGPAAAKIKGGETLTLELKRTPDIAAWAGTNRREGQYLVGFAAESENLIEAARGKLEKKGLDLICANAIGTPGLGFAAADNQVTLIDAAGGEEPSPAMDKGALARWIWARIIERLARRAQG